MKTHAWWTIPVALGCAAGVAVWAASGSFSWPGRSTHPAAVAETDALVLSSEELEQARAVASPIEVEALADGRLTYDEYRSAVQGSITCLSKNGFQVVHYTDDRQGVLLTSLVRLTSAVEGPATDGHGLVSYSATGGRGSSPEENGEIAAGCRQESQLIDRLWKGHLNLSDASPGPERLEALAACLRAAGVSVPEQPDEKQLRDAVGMPVVAQRTSGVVREAWMSCETQLAVPR